MTGISTAHNMKEKSPLPIYSEDGETVASVDILSLHSQKEVEAVNASTVVETFSPNLFRVIPIVPNKQDYSFVEKVQLPQDEVLGLCNKLVPSSASCCVGEPPRVNINFNSLNQLCLPAVGFYGDKNMIIRIFRKETLVDATVLAEMERRLLKPGLYVSLPKEGCSIVVFYWHEAEHFKQASRNDVSCYFIRYLAELCDSVHVCVEGSYPFEALAVSATNAGSKAKRTRRIQVSSVKNSENDVELFPGYSLRIDGGENSKKTSSGATTNVVAVNNYHDAVVFCEGYQHCCFLKAEKRSPPTSKKREELSVRASEFDSTLKIWLSASNVDYSRLSNEQFINLLECWHPQEFENLSDFKESLKMRESARRLEQAEEFGKCIFQVLPEFCYHVLLIVGGQASTSKDSDGHTNLQKTEELKSCSDTEIDGNRFEELHRELSMILAGESSVCNGDQRVLLLGSDIKFMRSDWEHMITVESPGQGKHTTPFIHYGQEVEFKCSSQCPCYRKLRGKAKFLQHVDEVKDFLFSGDKVKFLLSAPATSHNNIKEVNGIIYLVNKTASVSAIRSWVENVVPVKLSCLERNIVFTAFLLGSDETLAIKFMEEHLTTQDTRSLPRNTLSQFDREALLTHDTLKTVCYQIYKDQERKFMENIKELSALVFNKTSEDLGKAEQRRSREAEDKFVQELKKKMSTVNSDMLVTRYIEEVIRTSRPLWYANSRQMELNVKVSTEEEYPFTIVYKVCELIPMRKGIPEFNSNYGRKGIPEFNSSYGRTILPTCGESVELAVVNPHQERLFKVVILKSGELMVFIHNLIESSLYLYRCPKIGCNMNNMGRPIHIFRRGFDLLAVDEGTRSMALYGKERSKIDIFRFDESFRKVYWTGVEVNLESYKGSNIITWMHLIPGKMELLLVDDTKRARVAEIHERPMMKGRHISLPSQKHSLKACVSGDGYFFLVFRQLLLQCEDSDVAGTGHASPGKVLDIYVLGDTMSHLKTIPLDAREFNISDLEQLEAKVTIFGSQSQLLLYSHVDAPGCIVSYFLKTALAREVVQLNQVDQIKALEDELEIARSCPYLGYIYHIFDEFAVSPKLFRDARKCITFKVVMERRRSDRSNGEACLAYLEALIRQLKAGKDKDFSSMKIQFEVNNIENCTILAATEQQMQVKMGMWVRKLVSLVPIQIARAENNAMIALKDGLQIPADVSYVDSVSLAYSIRFGFYDAVLNSWKGKIKVISSMGKQSSGKSYLLNHLSGSLLDVAGGRCTDGVWMTVATDDDGDGSKGSSCLYVLLDFEGLDSFQRSEQEDMLLSVLNAAVSNITIFNKKDFHLDKDTESAFSRFQSRIHLLKQDRKLFKGLFYIAIKDVDTSDVEDLMQEFHQKISQICSKSQENFILKMYDGNVEIAAMAPYNRSEYYRESLSELAETVAVRIHSCYDSGFSFLRDLKLIIAQIAAKDWTSIDSKRVAVTVDILRRNLISAVHMGCLSVTNSSEELRVLDNFDTQEEVLDFPVLVGDSSCNITDTGLYLSPCTQSETPLTIRDVINQIRSKLEIFLPRNGSNGEEWHSLFESFLEALADRRHERVQQWISTNTKDFCDNDEVKRLQLQADVELGKVKQSLVVCGCKCAACFWRCLMEKGHRDQHSCMGSHKCTENCSYCAREGDGSSLCGDLAGHEGNHNCKKRNHTCGESCYFYEMSSNCNERCSLGPGHSGQHKCNSPQHICSANCSLPSCNNPCVAPIESNHETHQCHERYCQSKCAIDGCSRTCGVKDHFHDMDQNAEHLCGNEHACTHECEMPGICEIFTELVKQTRVFQGQRGSFEYELVSEQNGLRKGCCIPIPPYEIDHEGPHVHTNKEDSVHHCDTRCQSCGYFCQLPVDHSGLHDTAHGNMKNASFISEGEDIDIEDRKYKWGETGEAEMCNMYCKKQGRGHIHRVFCPGSRKCTGNLYDGSRHETAKYGPVDVPKDEMTHETYWQYVRFVDPCTEEEREDFDRCNHCCKSEEHEAEAGGVSEKSFCTEKLWHTPIKSTGQSLSSAGYITDDGHHFGCDHSKNVPHHAIFIIDRSGSMGSSDIMPTMAKFNNHNCKLGCVYEAILRFIQARLRTVSDDSVSVVLFDTSASVPFEMENLEEGVVDRLLPYHPGGGTTYSSGLDVAERILIKGAQNHLVDVKKPVVIFLSDGGNNGGADPLYHVDKMKRVDPRMILHTIMFGRDPTMNILIEMAKKGGGTFEQTLDEIQLVRSFENLAESFKP